MKSQRVATSPVSIATAPASGATRWRVRVLTLCCASAFTALSLPGTARAETLIQNRSWEYRDPSGALGKDVEEPDNPQLCAIPGEYYRDDFGNITEHVKRACGGAGAPEAWMPPTPYRSTMSVYADPRLPTKVTNAKGQVDTYTYDAYGRMLTQTSANGLVTTYGYDTLGRLTSVRRPDGNQTRFTYYLCTSDTVGASDPTSTVCLNQYTTTPDGVQVKFFTMKEELPVNASGAQNGPRVRYFYDALARQVSKVTDGFSGKGINEDTIYDALGRLTYRNRPYYGGVDTPQWTKTTYDDWDRPKVENRPDGGSTTTEYGIWGAGTSVFRTETVGAGKPNQVTKQYFNFRGDLIQLNDATNAITTFTVDAFSNVLSINSPGTGKGNSEQRSYLVRGTGSQYDTRGRVRWSSDISRGERAMQYNAHGDLARVLDTATATTPRVEYTYDAIGRVTKRTEADLVSQWFYDTNADGTNCSTGALTTKGWLCEATTDNGFDEKYAYDAWGNPARTTRGALQVSTTFNSDGRPADRTYPSGFKLAFGYQPTFGYLSTLSDAGTGQALVTMDRRDAEMHPLTYVLGSTNPVYVGGNYIAATGRPLWLTATAPASTLQSLYLTWDWMGNLSSVSDGKTGVLANYEYDALNRLTKESRSGWGLGASATPVFSWSYLPNGNIASTTNTLGTQTYNYALIGTLPSTGHQVMSITGTVNWQTNPSFTYDPRGNMLTGLGRSYTWNSFDMPVTVSKGSAQLAYLYGPDHQRVQEKYSLNGAVQRTTTYFTPSGMTTPLYEEEVQGATTTKKAYVHLDGQPIAVVQHVNGVRDTKYLLKDHLGSIQVAVKADGTQGDRLNYEPFGRRRYADGTTDSSGSITSTQTDRGYTGHEMLDEVGVVHMNGRLYDPWIQRFVSADTVIPDPGDPQTYNRYAYVRNNPLKLTDPTGHSDEGEGGSSTITVLAPVIVIGPRRERGDFESPSVRYNGVRVGSNGLSVMRTRANDALASRLDNALASAYKGIWKAGFDLLRLNPWMMAVGGESSPLSDKGRQQIEGADTKGTPDGPDGDEENKRGVGGKGWRGDKNWRNAVNQVSKGGTHEEINGTVPNREEGVSLLRDARARIDRIEGPHEAPNPHDYPHINYTTEAGVRGTIKITGL